MKSVGRAALGTLLLTSCLALPGVAWAQEEEIVVTGRRAADRAALEDKREADNQIDAVHADDVGRLPDQNVAEAVRRLPGITTQNDQGEGRYLTVRGVSPDLLNVTLNGQTAAAPEPESRQVKLDDIPSALIGAVTVSKTLTPDLDANAIAGQVNIETLTAFDRNRNFLSGRFAYGYSDINESNPYEADVSFGGLFGPSRQFGAVFALNYSLRELSPHNIQNTGDWIDVGGEMVPEGLEIRRYDTERQRTGAVANFDWRPNNNSEMFLRFLYSLYEDSETRNAFGIEFDDGSIFPAGANSGTFTDAEAFRNVRSRSENTSSFSSSLGGEWNFGERWLRAEATYSHTNKEDPNRDEWIFESDDDVQGDYAINSSRYTITPNNVGIDPFDPAEFAVDGFEPESRDATEDLVQLRVDYRFPISVGIGSDFQVGIKYLDRDKENNNDGRIWGEDGSSLTVADVLGITIPNVFSGDYPYGPTVNAGAANAYFAANPGEFSEDDEGTAVATLGGDYRVTEQITAAYAMARLRFGDLTLIPGVRVERTEADYAAKAFDAASGPPLDMAYNVFGSSSYTDWFPSVNARYDVGENLVLRAAATRSLGRPNYETIAPYVVVEDDEVAAGNPLLDPLYSTNFDISAEYYVGEGGILSVAVFHKEIENPIFATVFDALAGDTINGVTLTQDSEVESFANADEATVTGVEFNVQYELSFLPAPFNGLSVGANLTLVDSEASGIPGRSDTLPLLGQSDRVASAQLSYEQYGWSGRIAYTYRSEYLLEAGEDVDTDIYVDELHQWDARVAYAFNPHLTVFLEGSNLNDASYRTYAGFSNRMAEEERYGWTARTGLQFSY